MKQPTEERYVFDPVEFKARLLAIGRPKPAPKPPTALEKAQKAFAPKLEAVVKANIQSNERALEFTKAQLEEAERERDRAEYVRRMAVANEQAVELAYAQRQAEALAERRYDPLGLYERPNYKTHPDD